MATKHAATDDDAFDGALASLTAVRRDEVARARDAQARLSRLLRRGHAACLQGRSVEELRAWGEDAAAELASLGLSEPDGCGPVAEEQPAVRREVTADPSVLVGALETVPLQPPADGAATPSRAGPAGGAERAPSEKRGSGEAVVPGEAWPPAEEDSVVDVAGSVWQWEHRTGFRSYAAAESERIEEAWQSGESKVRLKAGKTGKIPMEIFFADMVQLDPTSGSQRNVRRVGHDSRFSRLERNLRQVWKAIHTGQLRWESSKQYRKRQATQRNQEKLSVIDASSMIVNKSQMFSRSHIDTGPATKRAHIGVWCGKLVQALWWNILTWLVTALNVFWIYWMAEHHEWTLVFWRPAEVIFIDFCFLLFFATELVIRVLSYRDATTALQSHFFLRDALVVALTLVEVVFFPMVSFASDAHELDPGSAWFTFALLVRLSRLVRVERLFRIFPQAATISRAIASGLESAAIILLMMIGFLFGFAVMLKTGVADRVVKEKYFSTMSRTLETLIVQGLFFDGILDYLQDCRDEFVGYFGMLFFVCVGQYIFLNMLIGVFSSVAAGATSEQVDRRAIAYLENNLASILECYLEDVPFTASGNMQVDRAQLGRNAFNLILQNLDVLDVLEACGTDIDGLQGMKDVLFPQETSEISFKEMYEVLLRLRRGKPASVLDVVELRELTRRRTEELRELLLQPAAAACGGERGSAASRAVRSRS